MDSSLQVSHLNNTEVENGLSVLDKYSFSDINANICY